MNSIKALSATLGALVMTLTATTGAFAASTSKVYVSGPLILMFLGFCALVVTIQLIPALITLYGMIKGALSGRETEESRSTTH